MEPDLFQQLVPLLSGRGPASCHHLGIVTVFGEPWLGTGRGREWERRVPSCWWLACDCSLLPEHWLLAGLRTQVLGEWAPRQEGKLSKVPLCPLAATPQDKPMHRGPPLDTRLGHGLRGGWAQMSPWVS